MSKEYYTYTESKIFEEFKTSSSGLSNIEAKKRLSEFGPNQLPETKPPSILVIFFRQFLSPFIYILLITAIISLFLGQVSNAIFVFIVLILNAGIGAFQEYSAQRAANSLKKMVAKYSHVIRDGKSKKIPATEIATGDIVSLTSGDKVSADLRLIQSNNLKINESLLTGESIEVSKDAEQKVATDTILANQKNMAFAGSIVTNGRALGVAIATGKNTQVGNIASATKQSDTKPPLLIRIEQFTMKISLLMLGIIVILFAIFVSRGVPLGDVFMMAIALAIAAIPEGLPAAITVALAIGMNRMAKKHVIVRKLLAVESLGSCTYIASDKTGTLTINKLTIQKLQMPNGEQYDVSGQGLDLKGNVKSDNEFYQRLVRAGIMANESELNIKKNQVNPQGDMVDVAFLILGYKSKILRKDLTKSYPEISRIPYESANAYSGAIHKIKNTNHVFIKGSMDKVLEMCSTMDDKGKNIKIDIEQIKEQEKQLAKDGFRVLALAEGETSDIKNKKFKNLTFLGLAGMIDPLRANAIDAIKSCHEAGIDVAMITGDHPLTATALATKLGLCAKTEKAITGAQIKAALKNGKEHLDKLVSKGKVFARIEPTQKKEITASLMRSGHFVAVTGDGVNDAPALSHAHVGIAMGKRGSDVAKESADLILTDDHFDSIVAGIKQGRVIYNNIRKVIFLLISTGTAEIILFLLSILFNMPMPLLATQLLWLNLVTNGIQDVAMAFEPAEGSELKQKPRPPKEPIFNKLMIERIAVNAIIMGILAFIVFKFMLASGASIEASRNITLLLMVLFENIHVLNSRSETKSIFKQKFFTNPLLLGGIVAAQLIHISSMYIPALKGVLQTAPVSLNQWLSLLGIAAILLVIDEIHKLLKNAKAKRV